MLDEWVFLDKKIKNLFKKVAKHFGISNLTETWYLQDIKQLAISDHLLQCKFPKYFYPFENLLSSSMKINLSNEIGPGQIKLLKLLG